MGTSPPSYDGLRIASFESRKADDTTRMIERFGGVAHVSPSMREIPVEADRSVVDFGHRLITGQIEAVILLTGVGTREMVARVERHIDRQRFLDTLADVKTIVRGPKPLAVMRELQITPTIVAPEPNTWREVLAELDAKLPVANLTVAVQEYGVPNVSLVAGLEARGAIVESFKVYRWDLPEDAAPLRENIKRLAAGELDLAMFTSAQQVLHVLRVAKELDLEQQVRDAFRQTAIASVGPTTSEMLRANGLPVDFEPSHPKLGHLVAESASQAKSILERKQTIAAGWNHYTAVTTQAAAPRGAQRDLTQHDNHPSQAGPFMRACRREPVPYTPIWLMRQAGRYMAEYREVRAKQSFLELCKNPKLCSEVMCTAVNRLGVDAAIIFSDLLPILEPMGLDLEFAPGDGPQIHNPVRESEDVSRVIELESTESLHFVFETVTQTRKDLPEHIPLIGFSGAPFTLASYAIEGGGSRNFLHTKTLMYREPAAWRELMERLSRSITRYLNAQIAAGAQAVQLFDSWVGCLSPADYRTFVLPHVRSIADGLSPGAPLIHFGTGNPSLLPLMAEAGGDVIGVDWRIDLADAWRTVGYDRAVQGNLDPTILLADRASIESQARAVLASAANRPGHIFNLGHGVLQQTPVDNVKALVEFVQSESRR
ncbi:uroporphyrinogen decarboxylase [Lacipirellula parvula]|uniref:Uroporphyrinogen decarboxylase n=1 Tax=Lacipirellula parvula TaxID=2650471 RepID=A0A5K7XNC6_9BACT|nr:uroporphyrinogen decarboxylase [Lacipirellula parvula]BBO36323.1 uroporphyrinogen III decarboxylase [Lacipirellula parvula]